VRFCSEDVGEEAWDDSSHSKAETSGARVNSSWAQPQRTPISGLGAEEEIAQVLGNIMDVGGQFVVNDARAAL
jgi:hypothetical protein